MKHMISSNEDPKYSEVVNDQWLREIRNTKKVIFHIAAWRCHEIHITTSQSISATVVKSYKSERLKQKHFCLKHKLVNSLLFLCANE